MAQISDLIKLQSKSVLIIELSESALIEIDYISDHVNQNRIYETQVSLFRDLHDVLISMTSDLYVVLYVKKGIMHDQYVNKYFNSSQIKDHFSIVRSKDELIFMMGCLFINSNKIVYVSEHKNSVSKNL